MKAIIALAASAAFTTTALAQTANEAPADYEDAVRTYFDDNLYSSNGARIRFTDDVYQARGRGRFEESGTREWEGWATDVYVNARLPSGGYSGYQRYTVALENDEVVGLAIDFDQLERVEN